MGKRGDEGGDDGARRAEDRGGETGICLSGGGIRSAAFALGAMQALQDRLGLLKGDDHATYLSAVSGGSYAAAAYELAAGGALDTPSTLYRPTGDDPVLADARRSRRTPDGHPLSDRWPGRIASSPARPVRPDAGEKGPWSMLSSDASEITDQADDGWRTFAPPDPFAPGSPESGYVRRHAAYMTESGGVIGSIALVIFLSALSVAWIVGFATTLGLVVGMLVRPLSTETFDPAAGRYGLLSGSWALIFGGLGAAVWLYALGLARSSRAIRRHLRAVTFSETEMLLRELSGLLVSMIALVVLGVVVPEVVWRTSQGSQDAELSVRSAVEWLGRGLGATGVLGTVAAALAQSRAMALPKELMKRSTKVANAVRVVALRLLQLAVSLLVPAVLGFSFYSGWIFAVTSRSLEPPLLGLGGALVVYGYFMLLGGLPNLTPYTAYRNRLARCFDILRQERFGADGTRQVRVRQRLVTPRLSSLALIPDVPELLICASGNVTEIGVTATGSQAQSVVFSPREVRLSGVPGARIAMADLELSLSKPWGPEARFEGSVLSCVAVAGAAVSPTMGKFTRAWMRSLLTFLNLRLGTWIPNPGSEKARELVAAKARDDGRRLKPGRSLRYFWRELQGRHYSASRYLYVSDGGHVENLGLLELLRLGCTEIWCIDASGDEAGSATTLAESFTLATSELGVRFEVDLTAFHLDDDLSDLGRPMIRSPFVHGTVTGPGLGDGCRIHVVKVGIDAGCPVAIQELRQRYPRFPYDSTLNQLYKAERFDLYRDLGYSSTARAIGDPACNGSG